MPRFARLLAFLAGYLMPLPGLPDPIQDWIEDNPDPGNLVKVMFFCILFFIAMAFYGHITRVERKRRYFEQKIKAIQEGEKQRREDLIRKQKKSTMKELAGMTKRELDRFRMEIPPKTYEAVKTRIDRCAQELNFANLSDLHDVLVRADNSTVWRDLEKIME